jgi:hypothetical protein
VPVKAQKSTNSVDTTTKYESEKATYRHKSIYSKQPPASEQMPHIGPIQDFNNSQREILDSDSYEFN